MHVFFFFKQKTAYDMRISDWSSDVCSSDLPQQERQRLSRIVVGRCQRRSPATAGLFCGCCCRCCCGSGFSRELLAPPLRRQRRVGVSSGIAANRDYPLPASPCLRRGGSRKLAAEAAPTGALDRKSVG